ncbi:MBL fold metallo-hydrolase [Planctomycetales bacterium ZRK34]|nr:MBL fold metallo-hydrolase [Planctomycetales bacterium ZRK34]
MPTELKIQGFCLGDWQTNCYVAHPAGSTDCWIIDAGFGPEPMIDSIEAGGLDPKLLVLTHAHVDHIAGANTIRQRWPQLPIVIHEAEAEFLSRPELNLSAGVGLRITAPPADQLLNHGDTLTLGDLNFEVRHTPGHSPGGVCIYQADNAVAFTGDTLFHDSIGRYDFPTSDGEALMRSIHEQLMTLPDPTRLYPGHMQPTTVGRERQMNPFL